MALSCTYTAGGCALSAIFSMGTNSAYLEKVASITKLENHSMAAADSMMMVNTKWGTFNNTRKVLPMTLFDSKVDHESINLHFQAYEKFILRIYLGKITCNLLTLIDTTSIPILFNGKLMEHLNQALQT
jgi:hexokinase